MGGFEVVLMVIVVNAAVLGLVLFAAYGINNAARQTDVKRTRQPD